MPNCAREGEKSELILDGRGGYVPFLKRRTSTWPQLRSTLFTPCQGMGGGGWKENILSCKKKRKKNCCFIHVGGGGKGRLHQTMIMVCLDGKIERGGRGRQEVFSYTS